MEEISVSNSLLQRQLVPLETTTQEVLEEKVNHPKFFSLDNLTTIQPLNLFKKHLLVLEHPVSMSESFKEKMDKAEVSDMLSSTPQKKPKKLLSTMVTILMDVT